MTGAQANTSTQAQEDSGTTKGKATFKKGPTENEAADAKNATKTSNMNKTAKSGAGMNASQTKVAGGMANERMLRNEEIREICEKHQLSRMEVYQIRSQFSSMCMMSQAYNESQDGNPNQDEDP